MVQARMAAHASTTRAYLKKSLRYDEAAFLKSNLRQEELALTQPGKDMWQILRRHLPKWKQRIRNQPVRFLASQSAFTEHFARIEDAVVVEIKDIANIVQEANCRTLETAQTIEIGIHDLPSIFELESAIRSMALGKSVAGGLVPELARASPSATAKLLYPALLDAVAWYQEPFRWKGGYLHPLIKKKNGGHGVDNHRSILIADLVPRLFHRVARVRIIKEVAPNLEELQIGGLKAMTVSYASMLLNLWRSNARQQKMSHAVIFFDIASAFYQAQKSTICQDQLGLNRAALDEEVAVLQSMQPSALDAVDANPSLQAWLQMILDSTWSQVRTACPRATKLGMLSRKGTRPGDPTADIAFTVLMTKILREVQKDIHDCLTWHRSSDGQFCQAPLVWIDDVAVYLQDPEPLNLVEKVRRVASSVHARCQQAGLCLNMKAGKTETIIRFDGRGSHAAHQYLQGLDGNIPLACGNGKLALRVQTHYVHLGQRQTAAMNIQHELDHRFGEASEALKDSQALFRNPFLGIETKCMLADSLVMSKLLFGTETWLDIKDSHVAKMQSFHNRTLRHALRVLNRKDTACVSDVSLRCMHGVPPMSAVLSSRRLRFLQAALLHGPIFLQTLLQDVAYPGAEHYRALLTEDFAWLQSHQERLRYLPHPREHWSHWILAVRTHSKSWKQMCVSAARSEGRLSQLRAMHSFCKSPQGALSSAPPDVALADDMPSSPFQCEVCAKTFEGAKALAVHRNTAHQLAADVRRYMPHPTVCGSCGKDYHSTQKLRQHLRYPAGQCLAHLTAIWWPMTEDQIRDLETVKNITTGHRVPALRRQGPVLPTLDQWRAAVPEKAFPGFGYEPADEPISSEEVVDWITNRVDAADAASWIIPSSFFLRPGVLCDAALAVFDTLEAWVSEDMAETLACSFASQGVEGLQNRVRVTTPSTPTLFPKAGGALQLLFLHPEGWDACVLDAALQRVQNNYNVVVKPTFLVVKPCVATALRALELWMYRNDVHAYHGVFGFLPMTSWDEHDKGLSDRTLLLPFGHHCLSERRYAQIMADNALYLTWMHLLAGIRAVDMPILQIGPRLLGAFQDCFRIYCEAPVMSNSRHVVCDLPEFNFYYSSLPSLAARSWHLPSFEASVKIWRQDCIGVTPFAACLDSFCQAWFARGFSSA
eukprot:Skav228228  [mRNA]  locus=scaffold3932:70869:74357:- [translate_table: standard]